MNNRLPIFWSAGGALLVLLVACIAGGQDGTQRTGRELIEDAAQQLYQGPPLEARLGCNVRLFGHELIGNGAYRQFGGGTGKTQLTLAMAAGGQVFRDQMQITDGRHYLYVLEKNRGVRTLVTVDLRKVSSTLEDAESDQSPASALRLSAVGGVPRLLTQLASSFDFGTPIKSNLGDDKNEVPVLIIPGKWKPEILGRLLPEHHQAILAGKPAPLEKLPRHLPHEVEITLGNDDKFPLFPYKVVYLRYAAEGNESPTSRSDDMIEILSLKLFEVKHRPDLKREDFDYKPENFEDVASTHDGTADYITRLGLKPASGSSQR